MWVLLWTRMCTCAHTCTHSCTHTHAHVHEAQTPAFPARNPAECHGQVYTQQVSEKVHAAARWVGLLGATGLFYLSDPMKNKQQQVVQVIPRVFWATPAQESGSSISRASPCRVRTSYGHLCHHRVGTIYVHLCSLVAAVATDNSFSFLTLALLLYWIRQP